MPSKSKSQVKLMNAAAHSKEFADKVGVPQKVAREFHEADKKQDTRKLPQSMNSKKK